MPNRFSSSFCHWPISDFGTISRMRCAPFGPALGDDQAGLDRLSEADFVSENATALAETSEREDHRVDLMGVRIDPRLPLGRCVALAVVRPADADEVLGEDPLVEGVEGHDPRLLHLK